MKKQLFALVGLGLLLATVSAYARTRMLTANIPFNFIVGKASLPVGEYMIRSLGLSSRAMVIQSQDGNLAKVVLPIACTSTEAQERTRLVFHRYGDQYFLAQIWTAGNDVGNELPKSRRETELAMDNPAQDVVVVATLR
jgi:hypothetical protein